MAILRSEVATGRCMNGAEICIYAYPSCLGLGFTLGSITLEGRNPSLGFKKKHLPCFWKPRLPLSQTHLYPSVSSLMDVPGEAAAPARPSFQAAFGQLPAA